MREIRGRVIKHYILDTFCIICLLLSAIFLVVCVGKFNANSSLIFSSIRCSKKELPRLPEYIIDKVYSQIAFIFIFYPNKMLEYHLCEAVQNYSIATFLINTKRPVALIDDYFKRGENEMTLLVAYTTWVKVNHGNIDKQLIFEARSVQKENFQKVNEFFTQSANNKELEQVLYAIKKTLISLKLSSDKHQNTPPNP